MRAAVRHVYSLCILGLLAAACGPLEADPQAGLDGSRQRQRHVVLPDLSAMDAGVQEQLRRAYAAIDKGELDGAGDDSARAEAFGELGHLFFAMRYAGSAEVCYDNAVKLAPLESRWVYYLGHAYFRLGALDRAAGAFNRVLQMDPDYVPARVSLGEAALAYGRPDLARLAFTAALSWEPRLPAALFGLGRAALAQQDYAAAADALERALVLEPGASAIRYPLALAYRGLGRDAEAHAHLRARGQVLPQMPDRWLDEIELRRRRLRAGQG